MTTHRLLSLLAVITLFLTSVVVAAEPADDPLAAAAARHEWRWFGLELGVAQERARAAGLALVPFGTGEAPAGTQAANEVYVFVRRGGPQQHPVWRIMQAQSFDDGLTEGCTDPALLPWLGLDLAAATAAAADAGRSLRVIARDGLHLPVTMDYREDRLNVHLRAGVVVAVHGG